MRDDNIVYQVDTLYEEFDKLSKKNPQDAVNKFKLRLINEIIGKANVALGEKERPFRDFDTFHEDELPTNSDVVVVLSQYRRALLRMR